MERLFRLGRIPGVQGAICLALTAFPAAAQTNCELVQSRNLVNLELGTGRASYVSAPRIQCQDGSRIEADSAAVFQASGFTQLFGRVLFRDGDTRLTADRAHFFNQQGRLLAWGDVALEDQVNRSVITGDTLVLLRANEFRPEDRLTVSGTRPRALIRPAPPADGGAESEPYQVDAQRIYLEGSDLFRAGGEVELLRDGLLVTSDSMEYVREEGEIRFLARDSRPPARVVGEDFELEGRGLDFLLPGDTLRRVLAAGDAVLSGEDFRLQGPTILVELEAGEVERGVAVRDEDPEAPRPEALAQDFLLRGDSIEIVAPAQEIQAVVAVGFARGEHTARDSLVTDDTPELLRRDWMEGDTIRATFLPSVAEDGESRPRMDRLVATGSARSLYRLEPSEEEEEEGGAQQDADLDPGGRAEPPAFAVHYVTGSLIAVFFTEGQVDRMEVEGPARGLHLEPQRTAGGIR